MTEETTQAGKAPRRIGRPSAEEAAAIEGRILKAAWELLLEDGAAGLTVERIARSAAVSKKTIYTRFSDRSEMMMCLLRHRLRVEESSTASGLDVPTFREAFCNTADRIIAFLTSPERRAIGAVLTELPEARRMAWDTSYAIAIRALDALLDHPKACEALPSVNFSVFRHVVLQCLIGHAESILRSPDGLAIPSERWSQNVADIMIKHEI